MPANDTMSYLRVSLVSGCNLSCFYCRPQGWRDHSNIQSEKPERFAAAIELLVRYGVRKVRFTGGEPTLYRGLVDLVESTHNLDDSLTTAITTNGLLLSKFAADLGRAGLDGANVSLDTLDPKRFHRITGTDRLKEVLAGISAAVEHIPTVKLNCVLMRGINDDEVENMMTFAGEMGVTLRFIEFMPSRAGTRTDNLYVAGDEIRRRIRYKLHPVDSDPTAAATYYACPELGTRVGFINPVSHPFCANCNRLRLTSDGQLYGCLFSQRAIDLFGMLDEDAKATHRQVSSLMMAKRRPDATGVISCGDSLPSFVEMGG